MALQFTTSYIEDSIALFHYYKKISGAGVPSGDGRADVHAAG